MEMMSEESLKVQMKKGQNCPCAQGEIRTPTALRPLPPQDSVSTNSTTRASGCDPAGARTQDPLLKRQLLYQLSYRINLKDLISFRKRDTKVQGFFSMSKINMNKIQSIFIALIISALSFGTLLGNAPQALLEQGNRSFADDEYGEALQAYESLYSTGHFTEEMLLRMSLIHEKKGDFSEAIFCLRKAGKEFGTPNIDERVRKIQRSHGGVRIFSSDGWDAYFAFFRSWNWVIWLCFMAGLSGVMASLFLPAQWFNQVRKAVVPASWVLLLIFGGILFHRSFMVPTRAVIVEATSFYNFPSYGAEHKSSAFAMGETVTVVGEEDIWVEVQAGGRRSWVPKRVLRQL